MVLGENLPRFKAVNMKKFILNEEYVFSMLVLAQNILLYIFLPPNGSYKFTFFMFFVTVSGIIQTRSKLRGVSKGYNKKYFLFINICLIINATLYYLILQPNFTLVELLIFLFLVTLVLIANFIIYNIKKETK